MQVELWDIQIQILTRLHNINTICSIHLYSFVPSILGRKIVPLTGWQKPLVWISYSLSIYKMRFSCSVNFRSLQHRYVLKLLPLSHHIIIIRINNPIEILKIQSNEIRDRSGQIFLSQFWFLIFLGLNKGWLNFSLGDCDWCH